MGVLVFIAGSIILFLLWLFGDMLCKRTHPNEGYPNIIWVCLMIICWIVFGSWFIG